jgi:hypothetical protein
VGLGGWEDEEGEKEDGAEGYAEDGGVVWNAEACIPI